MIKLKNGTRVLVDPERQEELSTIAFKRSPGRKSIDRSVWLKDLKRPGKQGLSTWVMGRSAGEGMVWCHINNNPLNFMASNFEARKWGYHLRPVTRQKNAEKVSETAAERLRNHARNPAIKGRKYIGVMIKGKKFGAQIVEAKQPGEKRRKLTFLGMAATKEETAKLYDAARIARNLPPVNFPEGVS